MGKSVRSDKGRDVSVHRAQPGFTARPSRRLIILGYLGLALLTLSVSAYQLTRPEKPIPPTDIVWTKTGHRVDLDLIWKPLDDVLLRGVGQCCSDEQSGDMVYRRVWASHWVTEWQIRHWTENHPIHWNEIKPLLISLACSIFCMLSLFGLMRKAFK